MAFWDRWFKPPTLHDVARDAIAWLRQRGVNEVQFDPELCELHCLSGPKAGTRLYLGHVLTEVQQAPRKARAQVLDRFLSSVLLDDEPIAEGYEANRQRLMPVLRTRSDLGVAHLSLARSAPDQTVPGPVHQALVGELLVCLVIDQPNSMAYVMPDQLKAWGVNFEQALDDALNNLRGLPEQGGWRALEDGVWSGEWGDAYESSRLLLPDLIHRLGVSEPVAMVPFRNAILVTSRHHSAGLQRMVQVTQDALARNNRWLWLQPLQLDERRWQVHQPMEVLAGPLRVLDLQQRADAYNSQKPLLEALLSARGQDLHVATMQVMQRGDEPPVSFCVWGEGVDSLLPQTDQLALAYQDGEEVKHQFVPWALALAAWGDLLQPTDDEPPRFRVRAFPSRDSLAAMPDLPLH